MRPMKISDIKRGAWLGAPADYRTYHYAPGLLGRRIVAFKWHDKSKEIEISIISGDGRRTNFKSFGRECLPAGSTWDDVQREVEKLAEMHFRG